MVTISIDEALTAVPPAMRLAFLDLLADRLQNAPEFAAVSRADRDLIARLLRVEASHYGPH